MILEEIKKQYVKDIVTSGKRTDGRTPLQYRPITVTKGYLQNAEGSALAQIGDTKVLAAVKIDLLDPFADRPNEGVVMFNCEFSPMAHPAFNPGPPDENSIELARVCDRGIRSAEVVDVQALGNTGHPTGKVLGVFVDLYVLDHNGNLTDCAALAAMAALNATRLPKVVEGKIMRTESSGNLPLRRKVVAFSFENVAGKYLLDASSEEEVSSDGRVSISVTDDGFLCSGQKSGMASITKDKLVELTKTSMAMREEMLKLV